MKSVYDRRYFRFLGFLFFLSFLVFLGIEEYRQFSALAAPASIASFASLIFIPRSSGTVPKQYQLNSHVDIFFALVGRLR